MVDQHQWGRPRYEGVTLRPPAAWVDPSQAPPRPLPDWPPPSGGYGPSQSDPADRYGGVPAPAPRTRAAWGRRRLDASRWHWLLFVPVVVPLITPLYNRVEPTLGGVPFFYWGQLAFAALASLVVTIVHLATKGK